MSHLGTCSQQLLQKSNLRTVFWYEWNCWRILSVAWKITPSTIGPARLQHSPKISSFFFFAGDPQKLFDISALHKYWRTDMLKLGQKKHYVYHIKSQQPHLIPLNKQKNTMINCKSRHALVRSFKVYNI